MCAQRVATDWCLWAEFFLECAIAVTAGHTGTQDSALTRADSRDSRRFAVFL